MRVQCWEGGGVGAGVGAGFVIQQLSSPGHVASESISSQKRANKPLTHSPLQGRRGGDGLEAGGVVIGFVLVYWVDDVEIEIEVEEDDDDEDDNEEDEFEEGLVLFLLVIIKWGVSSAKAFRDTQHRNPCLQ